MSWKVIHLNHDDSELGEAFPGSPEWAVYLSRPGYLNYDIDFTSPLCNITNTEPMATDFILKFDDLEVMGGEHTSINVNDIDEHTLQINGKDWLNYLDTLTWPFDPDHPLDNPYVQADYDTGQMVNDLLVEILGQTYVPTFTYQLTLTGVVSDYRIEPGDQESLLAKITNLSQIEPGFDFDISPRRTITLYVPKKGSVKDFIFEHSLNCMISPYKNDGPKATHMLGMGQSTSAKFGFAKDSSNIATYRRRDITQEYQGVHKRKQVKAKVNSDIKRLSAPQKQFTVKWLGDTYELLSNVQVGDTVPVVGLIGNYDFIDDAFRVVSITCNSTDDTLDELTVTFDDGSLTL